MSEGFGYNILKRLQHRELLAPYLEQAMLGDKWPDSYQIEVDSSPYTGRGDGWFHPSSHCLPSPRWLYYQLHPDHRHNLVEEKRSLTSEMALSMGSALHAVVQTQFIQSGLITEDDIEVPCINEERRGKGNMDFRVHHPNGKVYGVEFKTQNTFSFERSKGPQEFWVAQLNCYMDWQDLDEGIILVLESGYPYRVKEHHISRNPTLLSEIYQKWEYVLECIERDTPPTHCCALGSSTMEGCEARFECWLAEEVPK